MCIGTPVSGKFLFIQIPYGIVNKGVTLAQSLERAPFINIRNTDCDRDKKQYLYCAIVLNTADFGNKEMKVKKSSYYALHVLVYKVRHSTHFLTTSSAIAKAKGIPNRYKPRIEESLSRYK